MKKDKAHRIAMKQCIDKGRNPVALIDGVLQFVDNHADGSPMDDEMRDRMEDAITAARLANQRLERVLLRAKVLGHKAYYKC